MKAWIVKEKDEFASAVVFADTRGKARMLAMRTETCEDVDFCDIEAHRRPDLDKYYVPGKKEMDWFKSDDRIALVRDGGFSCSPDYWEPEDCKTCPAAEYCHVAKDRLREQEEADEC